MFPTQRFGRIVWSLVAAMGLCLADVPACGNTFTTASRSGPTTARRPAPWRDTGSMPTTAICAATRKTSAAGGPSSSDPTLNQLIAHAYRQNISLKEAGFRILEARAQRGIAVGGLFPQSQTATGGAERVALAANSDFARIPADSTSTSTARASTWPGSSTSGDSSAARWKRPTPNSTPRWPATTRC